jgi:hypothetical protein
VRGSASGRPARNTGVLGDGYGQAGTKWRRERALGRLGAEDKADERGLEGTKQEALEGQATDSEEQGFSGDGVAGGRLVSTNKGLGPASEQARPQWVSSKAPRKRRCGQGAGHAPRLDSRPLDWDTETDSADPVFSADTTPGLQRAPST